jgi:hypothetical protein
MGTPRPLVFVGLFLVPAVGAADEIYLRGGGKVTGVIAQRTRDTVAIDTGPGRVTLPMRRVERIVDARSALQEYQEHAEALAASDVDGWARLARWAAERGLQTRSREAWQRVLAFDPTHPEANAAMGRMQVNGVWMASEEAYRVRGFVPFEGRWVTPAEHEALVRERLAEDVAAQQRREQELLVREAEARAREAEAAATSGETGGIPYGWVYGGWGWAGHWGFRHHPLVHRQPLHPPMIMGPRPRTTPPSSIGATPASAPVAHGVAPGQHASSPSRPASVN